MKSVKLDPLNPSHRRDLQKILAEWQEFVLDAYDRQEAISLHSHQEMRVFGRPDLLSEFIFQGWSFGVSIGDYPRQKAIDPRTKQGGRRKKREAVGSDS